MPTFEFTAPDGKSYEVGAPEGATQAQAFQMLQSQIAGGAPAAPAAEGFAPALGRQVANAGAGAIKGASEIGATLLAPLDAAYRATGLPENSIIGRTDRRQAVDEALGGLGADPSSIAYGAGKVGAEVAGTLGVGGGVATLARPLIGRFAAPLVDAVASSGMRAGGMIGVPGMLTRMAGGAATGAASAGLVNPDTALSGAAIGAAAPPLIAGAGQMGAALGNRIAANRSAQMNAYLAGQPLRDTLSAGIDAGYVVPPSSVNPSFVNNMRESIAGKIATAQTASSRNQEITDALARKALGLSPDAPLSVEAMGAYRKAQTQAGYEPLRKMGMLPPDPQFNADLAAIAARNTGKGTIPAVENQAVKDLVKAHQSPTGFDSGDAVDAIRTLREKASDAFRQGDTALARTNREVADAYEQALERGVPANNPGLLNSYRTARANIAKSFSIEDALKEGTGSVDARKLATALQGGAPLSGDLLTAGRFASAFPKATQPPSLVAGPGVHNMKAYGSGGGAAAGAFLGGPVGAAVGSAIPWIAPPLLRAQMFSKGAQRALIPGPPATGSLLGSGAATLQSPEAQMLLLRSAPAAARASLLGF